MSSGYLYLAAGLLSFSLLGVFAKIADLKRCRPAALYVMMCFSAAVLAGISSLSSSHATAQTPFIVAGIALPFGALGALAGVALQAGIRYGKLATSWLIINLSAAVPTIGSVLVYRERISGRHVLALILMTVSVFLLWKDKEEDERKARLRKQATDLEAKACG